MKKNIFHDFYATIAIMLATIIATVLHFTGILDHKQAVSVTLSAVAGLAISMFLSSLKADRDINAVTARLENRTISRRVTRKEHYKLLNAAVNNANSRIWIMTIEPKLGRKTINTIPEREQYYETLKRVIKKRREISVRRIYGLPTDQQAREDKIEWVISDIEELKKCPNFQARIFDWHKHNTAIHPLSLQIVDDTFLGMVNLQYVTGFEGGGEDLCTEDRNTVRHLSLYYEVIWGICEEIKTGDSVRTEILRDYLKISSI
jgi:hypothetical protein